MKYSYKYEQDIKKIKSILDPHKKREAILKIAKAYNKGERTIYRHLKMKIPGLRKIRNDSGKVKKPATKKEAAIMRELVKAGKTRKNAKKVLEQIGKKKISTVRLVRISKKAAKETDSICPDSLCKNIKDFLKKYFNLDNISEDSLIKLNLDKHRFKITKDDFNEIIMILANAYNRSVFAGEKKLQLDRDLLRKQMILNLIEEQIRIARESQSTKDIEALTRMHDRMSEQIEVDANIKVVEKVCRELKPDITFSEIVELIKKNSE